MDDFKLINWILLINVFNRLIYQMQFTNLLSLQLR